MVAIAENKNRGLTSNMSGWPTMLVQALTRVHEDPGPPTPTEEAAISVAAIQEGLKKMFRPDGYLCIVDMKTLYIQRHGVDMPSVIHDRLRALHCVHWRDMDKQAREDIQTYLIRILQSEGDLVCPRV